MPPVPQPQPDLPATHRRLVLPAAADSPARARHAVCDSLDVSDACRQELQLLVSEAVTNAVRHGGGRDVVLELDTFDHEIGVRVLDGGGRTPRPREPGADGGYGLHLVEALASAWGAGAGELWFRLRLL